MRVLVLNGPNLNLLGRREPELYGHRTYAELEEFIRREALALALEVEIRQTNHEGVLVDWIQAGGFDALVLNAAAYTHTSVAVLDALKATGVRTIEVHLTNPAAREDFRRRSLVALAAERTFAGRGFHSYAEALRYLAGTDR